MPCNQLAVQAAMLQVDERAMALVFGNAVALQAMRERVAGMLGQPVGMVSVWSDRVDWWNGYHMKGQLEQQCVPLADIANGAAQYIDVAFELACFRIYRNGRIETRDGWRVGYQSPSTATWQASLAQIVKGVAVQVVQNAVAETLRSAGVRIISDNATAQVRQLVMEV